MGKLNESFENEEQPLRSIMSEFSVGLASEMEHFKRVMKQKMLIHSKSLKLLLLSIVYGISTIQT